MDSNDFQDDGEAMADLKKFDNKMRSTKNLEDRGDSSSEDEDQMREREDYGKEYVQVRREEVLVLKEKNQILMDRLFKSDNQVRDYKETFDSVASSNDSLKDRKIVEMAKKNRALQLQVESYKNKAAKAAEIAIKLKKESSQASLKPGSSSDQSRSGMPPIPESPLKQDADPSKKVKELEKRVTKLRNENQSLGIQVDKATRLLERETGEAVDIDSLHKEESTWKGRAQKIEILKAQVKKYKMQSGSVFGGDDTQSMMSEFGGGAPSVFSGKITNAERNLSRMDANRGRELENLKLSLADAQKQNQALTQKLAATTARKETLESQVKGVKDQFGQKIQILIEKTENDDKLITMLKSEIKRLEQARGVKSQLNTGGVRLQPLNKSDELTVLRGENQRLKNQVKCNEIDLEQKEEKISSLMTSCVGAPDERYEEKEMRIIELEEKVESLEKEKFTAKQENKRTFTGQPRSEDSEKLIKDITKQNATLRRKLDDATQKVSLLEQQIAKK